MMNFFIECLVPKAGKKNNHGAVIIGGKARVFKRKEAVAVENTWLGLLTPHRPKEPLQGPVSLTVIIYFPLLVKDTATKARRELWETPGMSVFHPKRPDLSNMAEAIQDAMTTLRFWNDDAQVCELRMMKKRRKLAGVQFVISQPERVELR